MRRVDDVEDDALLADEHAPLGKWTATGSLGNARTGDAVRLAEGRVLVNGSWRGEVYSPVTGTWTPTDDTVYR